MPSDFSDRFGYERTLPERRLVEDDSPRLRGAVWDLLSNDGKAGVAGYKALCRVTGVLPDSDVWSERSCTAAALGIIERMLWVDVYEALENIYASAGTGGSVRASKSQVEIAVNDALARSGLAYEMRGGKFEFYDAEAAELGILDSEKDALGLLDDEFAAVYSQYRKAVEKLSARPVDLEGAVGDALNSLEAVTGIVTNRSGRTLGENTKFLFPDGEGYHQPLRDAISKLYGYSNAVPGVRHGRYAEPIIARAESVMTVRTVGAIIAFLITDFRSRD